jgi:hypothetical protein
MATSDPWARVARRLDASEWLVPLGLFLLGVVVYTVLASSRTGPVVDNDEYLYGNLAQSVASGAGLTWRGVGPGLRTLYPYVIAPAWLGGDGVTAYELAKGINAMLLASTVWPVWALSRELVGPRLAALPPALFLVGMWMESSARIMTEALAIPGAAIALCALTLYLRRRTLRWLGIALLGAAIATLARSQLAVLVAAMAVAMTIEVLRQPRGHRAETARQLRVGLVVCGLATAAIAVALALDRTDVLLSYSRLVEVRPNLGDVVKSSFDYMADLSFMVGVVPWLMGLALLGTRNVWRDERVGSFASALASTLLVFILFASWMSAGFSLRPVERYVFYVAPMLLIAVVVAVSWVRWRAVVWATAFTVAVVVLAHHPREFGGEAQALFGAAHKLGFTAENSGNDFMWQLAGVTAAVGAVISTALWLRSRSALVTIGSAKVRTAPATFLVCLAIAALGMALVSQAQWQLANSGADRVAGALFGGHAPDRVDQVVGGGKTLVASNVPPSLVLWVEFFNKDIDRVVLQPTAKSNGTAGYGDGYCPLRLGSGGRLVTSRACGASNRTFVLAAYPQVRSTLRNETRSVEDLDPYGVIQVVSGEPRLTALRTDMCPPPRYVCRPAAIRTWTESPAVLELQFAGGAAPAQVEVARRIHELPPGQPTVVRTRLRAGRAETPVRLGWAQAAVGTGVPVLESLRLLPSTGRPIALN